MRTSKITSVFASKEQKNYEGMLLLELWLKLKYEANYFILIVRHNKTHNKTPFIKLGYLFFFKYISTCDLCELRGGLHLTPRAGNASIFLSLEFSEWWPLKKRFSLFCNLTITCLLVLYVYGLSDILFQNRPVWSHLKIWNKKLTCHIVLHSSAALLVYCLLCTTPYGSFSWNLQTNHNLL